MGYQILKQFTDSQVENVILTLDVAKIQHKQFFKAII